MARVRYLDFNNFFYSFHYLLKVPPLSVQYSTPLTGPWMAPVITSKPKNWTTPQLKKTVETNLDQQMLGGLHIL